MNSNNTMASTVYIDGDGCSVKDEVYRATGKYGLVVFVVANSYMKTPIDPRIRLVVVESGADVADDWIAERVGDGDIVITTDIPLADRCLKKGARVLNTRGGEFTPESIGNAVATRDLMEQLRMMGQQTGGPPPVKKKDRSQFSSKLHQVIQSLMN
jgi:uncharacterized protein